MTPEEKQKIIDVLDQYRIYEDLAGDASALSQIKSTWVTDEILNAMPEEKKPLKCFKPDSAIANLPDRAMPEKSDNQIAKRKINEAFRLAVIDLDDNIKRLLDWLDQGGER